ncbi:amino acid permease [Spirochaeta africana]|uniref:Amino acid transporter n=1 Tax=Spirochaeta africana (strain ATCC 700263 / DSM 8902 / Z-7692) TaxID=889378 RepID=H9UFM0_SPIAZ|nr:amino acid permease [Spirochaeta africana]AFG36313.1 amino acid transporter [Spirochaeta africana DSM 8902]
MKRFGTFSGVFVPSFEAILGAVLFLILPLLVGQVGMVNMLIIVVLANTATLATGFSIADSATNLADVGGGGMYAVSKQSLGRAFGGSIGVQIYIAQAVSIGFYCIGFAEPLEPLLRQFAPAAAIIEQYGLSSLQTRQVIATLFAVVGLIVALVGADFVSGLQMIILVVLSAAVLAIFVSPLMNPTYEGSRLFAAAPNLTGSGVRIGFAAAFAIFFPAVTGIDAGVGMSGSLKTPQRSLVIGTFAAIGVTTAVYLGVTVVFGFVDPQLLLPRNGQTVTTLDLFSQTPVLPLVLMAGILLATSSSALSYFLTAPRTLQALIADNVMPRQTGFLGRDFRAGGSEPRIAALLTFAITTGVIWSGDISFISMVVGICFLVVYGWVNFAAFLEHISGNPSFRPSSRGHWLISLYGFLLCLGIIALFNIWVGIAVLAFQVTIFSLILRYKTGSQLEGVWWGALFALMQWLFGRMGKIIQGTKNWRPIVGTFAFHDRPNQIDGMLEMGKRLAEYKGIVSMHVLADRGEDDAEIELRTPTTAHVLRYNGDSVNTMLSGIIQSVPAAGFGMNTVMLPVDPRFDAASLIEYALRLDKHVLLYKPAGMTEVDGVTRYNRIDVWWKGAENGSLMALLAHVVRYNDMKRKQTPSRIRFLRKLWGEESTDEARREMQELLRVARLDGEVVIIDQDDQPIAATVCSYSSDARLVFLGLPGKPAESGKAAGSLTRFFNIDRKIFQKNFEPYAQMPEMLFVKAAHVLDLRE